MRCGGPGLCSECTADASRARAALAQPSQSQYEASFEEWLANELEGEDGQPVPAAVCDITLARRAFNHWPKLEQPAKVGSVRFSAGVSSRLVVEAAQRLCEFESTPEKEAERIERLQAFREQLDPLNLTPHAEAFNEAPAEALRPEQAEAKRPAVVGYRSMESGMVYEQDYGLKDPEALTTVAECDSIVGELRAEIAQLRQHKNDYMDAGQETYRALQNEIREREAEIARLDGLVSGRTAERDAALANVDALAVQVLKLGGTISFAHHRTAQAGQVPQAWLDVQAERRRQITAEGWTPEHDDLYCAAELPRAAAAYILNGANDEAPAIWPFSAKWWKPRDARSNYVRASALILAEIERLDRAAAPGKEGL
ncbi:hypothetical protein PA13_1024625 [Pseudomonas aeruginosa HB13]|nr:hypothetical protein PA13_1024625 [Pseudomonas aeruginosa HB13]